MFANRALTSCPNIERLPYTTCLVTDDYLHFMYNCNTFVPSALIPKPVLSKTQKETAEMRHPIRYPEPSPLEFDPEILRLRCLGLVG